MKVLLEDQEISVAPGMTIRHVLRAAGLLKESKKPVRVYDEWGNEMGLDGRVTSGMKLRLKRVNPDA